MGGKVHNNKRDNVKYFAMLNIILLKFQQNKYLLGQLLATHNALLAEASTHPTGHVDYHTKKDRVVADSRVKMCLATF